MQPFLIDASGVVHVSPDRNDQAYFAPSILAYYNYSTIQTQLISVPPWAAAFGLALITAFFSDLTKHRFLWALLPIAISITGFSLLLAFSGPASRDTQYAALFLAAAGTYSAMPIIVCWFQMNLGECLRLEHRPAAGDLLWMLTSSANHRVQEDITDGRWALGGRSALATSARSSPPLPSCQEMRRATFPATASALLLPLSRLWRAPLTSSLAGTRTGSETGDRQP